MRMVIKLGTSVLTNRTAKLHQPNLIELVRQIAQLRQNGHEPIVVSSGAIAAGRERRRGRQALSNLSRDTAEAIRPENLVDKQVLAAIGQVQLMTTWQNLCNMYDMEVGQMLLTRADLEHRERFLNARDTLLGLLSAGILPIINENDAVATAEIKVGDNDNLSARVALLANAERLVLLTDQPGLMTADPSRDPTAQLIPEIQTIDEQTRTLAGGPTSGLGTGGMQTKLQAAQLARQNGVEVIIAGFQTTNVLLELVAGSNIGTRIASSGTRLESRKRWLLSGPPPLGELRLDHGACQAVQRDKKSLLSKGIVHCSGNFHRGDAVQLLDDRSQVIGLGLARYSSTEIQQVAGRHSDELPRLLGYWAGDAIVHRDEMIVFT
jgi:glutamate 5-kinase